MALGEALGAELLRTDLLRHEVFGAGPHPAEADGGIYSAQARERIYEIMFRRASTLNADRISVVLDGTFSTAEALHRAQQLTSDPSGSFLAIECVCRPEIAHERISGRLTAGTDASDARPEIHDLQRMRWQPWPADILQLRIDTEQPLVKQVEQVIANLAMKHWHNEILSHEAAR
jgi:predicted kinase